MMSPGQQNNGVYVRTNLGAYHFEVVIRVKQQCFFWL